MTAEPKTLMDYNLEAKGRRPHFFDDPAVDKVLAMLMTMAGELSVTRERLDTLERILERRGGLSREEIEEFQASEAEAKERAEMRSDYVARLLRVLQTEIDNIEHPDPDAAYEARVKDLAEN